MDGVAWLAAGTAMVVALVLVALGPMLKREHRRRQASGRGGSLAGVGAGLDVVWRPSAEQARSDWQAQAEMPAPAPSPDDQGLRDGRIVIRTTD